ncbi:MAG: tetratricopeptide repeat protein [Chitinophagales bacterium]
MKNIAQTFLLVLLLVCTLVDTTAQTRKSTNSRSNAPRSSNSKSNTSNNSKTDSDKKSSTAAPTRTVKKKKKEPKDLSGFDLRYQDMIARYNRYFNASIRYGEGTLKLTTEKEDVYQEVLPVYPYNGGDGTGASTEMSAVIDKTSAMIQIRPYSKWVDDAYLLLGKANFLMGDYDKAIQSFQYINSQHSNEMRKKPPVVSKEKRAKARAKAKKLDKKSRVKRAEDLKKERDQAKKDRLKDRNKAKKETQKERDAATKEREQAKKETLKEREAAAKERDKAKKETLKEREAAAKEREQAKKETLKEREATAKEREQAKKETLKEREATAKEREKTKKETLKEREQAKKDRLKEKKKRLKAKKKGKKYIPPPPKAPKVEKTPTPKKEKEPRKEKEKKTEKKEKTSKKDKATKEEPKVEKPKEKEPEVVVEEESKVEDEIIEEVEETLAEAEVEETAEEEEDKGPSEKEQKRLAKKSSKKYVSNGAFSHKLVDYDAQIWMIRTYIDMAEYGQAATVLDRLEEDETFPKRLAGEYSTLKAHYYLKRGSRGQAKLALQDAVRKISKKEGRARLYFILGQLEEKDENYDEAIAAFKKAIKSKPPVYDMEFHAEVNMIRTKMKNDQYSAKDAIRALEKMLKDDKNEDLQDQIYFAMAEVAIESGDIAMATEYFKKAAEVSTANDQQKALAFLRLAEIFFERQEFVQAGIFYDSTLVYLTKEYENYEEISRKKEVLSDLVAFSQAVELQDSLQQIANLPNAVRAERIEELIEYFALEAEKKKQMQLQNLEANADKKDKKNTTWLFYNPALVQRGKTQFNIEWGARPRVDNWRITSKISSSAYLSSAEDTLSNSGLDEAEALAQANAKRGEISRDEIMSILPLTTAKMEDSHQKIKDGLYGMGKVYNDKLENPSKAKDIYEELMDRYPDNQYAEEVLYSLYLITQKLTLTAEADKYKKQLLSQYPDGKYAKIISSPDYLAELGKEGKKLQNYYEKTYKLFKQEKFEAVSKRMTEVNEKFDENPMQPKFDLLAALVVGHSQDKTNYIAALEGVVNKHPEHEVKDKATEILKYLQNQTSEASGASEAASIYKYKPESRHYLLVALDDYTSKINSVINNLSDFNKGNFNNDRLKVQQMLLDPTHQVVLVKQFENADKAMIYYKTIKNKEVEVMQGADVGYQIFVMSKSNFTQYFKQKDANAYMEFFMGNYVE